MPVSSTDLEICQKVTRAGGSNLSLISKGLSKPMQVLFAPTYASMRLIDDMVDENFLTLDLNERKDQKQDYLQRLDEWENICIQAAEGREISPTFKYKLSEETAAAIFRGLTQTLGHSSLGAVPWAAMSNAMRWDVEEKQIQTWEDFESYGWGATVSPTAVFLYILTCKYDPETASYSGRDGLDLMTQAKSMGLFCYLVHIARDLVKDSKKTKQLLTVPQDILQKTNSDNHLLSDTEIAFVTKEILSRAESYMPDMLIQRDDLLSQMSLKHKLVFKSLLGLYMSMYKKLVKNPMAAVDGNFEVDLRNENSDFSVSNTD